MAAQNVCDVTIINDALENNNGVYFFSKEGCKYCKQLEEELNSMNISYTKYLLDASDGNYACISTQLKQLTGMSSFPMLYFGKTKIGGYSEFRTLKMTNALNDELHKIGLKIEDDF